MAILIDLFFPIKNMVGLAPFFHKNPLKIGHNQFFSG
jgi:hypothetical protein